MAFLNDRILHYNNGDFGRLGYALPNLSKDNLTTLNGSIHMLVDAMGRNLFAIMHRSDADLRVPPKIGTLMSVHKLCVRARSIMDGRVVEHNVPEFQGTHVDPPPKDFILYPTPYFQVQNRWMKEWAELLLYAMSEAAQHTDNRREYEVTPEFAGAVGQYIHLVYRRMATELFGKSKEEASALDFTLQDSDFNNYDPTKFFTSTELVDHPRLPVDIPTDDDLRVLSDGIRAIDLLPFMTIDPLPPPGAGEITQKASSEVAVNTEAKPVSFRPPVV